MATASTSYLQTLPKDEAIAFVASLQSVKAHLSQALLWLETQVQQKTVQLQGIETLLFEAPALGLVVAIPHSIPAASTHASAVELPATAKGSPLPAIATEPVTTAIAALPTKNPSKPPPRQPGKVDSAKVSRDSQPSSAAIKTSTAKTKQPKPSTPLASKVNQRDKTSHLQPFLKSQWRDKALTAAVGDILDQATVPLSTDEVMAALYDGLPQADYDRAKHSLANTLSVGKSKGVWKSTGRERYAGNAVATA